jgi:hypothetical protein
MTRCIDASDGLRSLRLTATSVTRSFWMRSGSDSRQIDPAIASSFSL